MKVISDKSHLEMSGKQRMTLPEYPHAWYSIGVKAFADLLAQQILLFIP